ncbi:hypothetical protein ABID58_007583, partial [Bradyrhizobium sp. S3.2.6]
RRYVARLIIVNPAQKILAICGNYDSVVYGRALSVRNIIAKKWSELSERHPRIK